MDTPRIKISHKKGEVAANTFGDLAWARAHRQALLDQYGACVLLIYEEKVVGQGQTLPEAITDAEQTLPAQVASITPVIQYLAPMRRLEAI